MSKVAVWARLPLKPGVRAEAAAAFEHMTRTDADDQLSWQADEAWPNSFRKTWFVPAIELVQAERLRRVCMQWMRTALDGVDLAEISITSGARLIAGEGPADAFRLDAVKGVAVVFKPAEGRKCARSWKISHTVGSDPQYPDVTPRDAQALREWETTRKAAE